MYAGPDVSSIVSAEPVEEAKMQLVLSIEDAPKKDTPGDSAIVRAAVQPPLYAHFLIYLLLPKKQRDGLLGDLSEDYPEVYTAFGPRLAAVWYWKNVTFSFGPLFVQGVMHLVQWYRTAK